MTIEQLSLVVGQAWESSTLETSKQINVAITALNNSSIKALEAVQKENKALKTDLESLKKDIELIKKLLKK